MFMQRLPISTRRCVGWSIALFLFLWSPLPQPSSAQQTHTLNIRGGTVYVDGRALPDDQLPDDLNLEGITAEYRFLGIQRPVVELNGRLFAVDDGLRPVTEEEVRQRRDAVVLRDAVTKSESSSAAAARSESNDREYLDAVERSSRDLYERLVREKQMEENARGLARTIRLLPDGDERRAKIDTLRAMLQRIFTLKQENRRREIRRLERQIREIEKSIRKREEMREQMIERRLRHLIDSTRRR